MNTQSKERCFFLPLIFFTAFICFISTELSLLGSAILIVFFTVRHGIKYTIPGVFFLFSAGYLKNGLPMGFLLIAHALSAYAIGFCINKKKKFSFMLFLSTSVEVGVLTGYTIFLSNCMNYKPIDLLFGERLRLFLSAITSSGQFSTDLIENLQISIQYILTMLQSMLPTLFLFVALFYVYILFGVSRLFLEKQKTKIDFMPYFHELRLPGSISGIFVLLFIISFFYASPILANVISFVFMLHVICGISVTDHYMRIKGVPGGIRVIILTSLFILSSLAGGLISSILCCVGMSDFTRDMRR